MLTQWYDPEPGPAALPGALARGLAARGHDVHVLTGFPNYPTGRLQDGYRIRRRQDEVSDGVQVHRVALYPSHDGSAAHRLVNYASFGASALVNGLDALRDMDALWVNYSPITVAPAMLAARHAFKVPVVTHVLDLWPDTVAASGRSRGRVGQVAEAVMHRWCRAMYDASQAVAFISPGVGDILAARGVARRKLHYVPMWAEEAVFHPGGQSMRDELGISSHQRVLLYAGAMGEAQGLDSLVEACAQVDDQRLVCLLAGSGSAESRLRDAATRHGLTNTRFLGRVPQHRMTDLMATADATYLSLAPHPHSDVTMPSKCQASLASGVPVLAAAGGDVARVVGASGGWVVPAGDTAGIRDALGDLCRLPSQELHSRGASARAYYLDTFSLDRGVTRVETLLDSAQRGHH